MRRFLYLHLGLGALFTSLVFSSVAFAADKSCSLQDATLTGLKIRDVCQLRCAISARGQEPGVDKINEKPESCTSNSQRIEKLLAGSGIWDRVVGCSKGSAKAAMENLISLLAPPQFIEYVKRCKADDDCKRGLARQLEQYRARSPEGGYVMTDPEVDKALKESNQDFNDLLQRSKHNQGSTMDLCQIELGKITRTLSSELGNADDETQQKAVLQKRFDMLAAYDADCPRLLKFQSPQLGITKPDPGKAIKSAAQSLMLSARSTGKEIEKWTEELGIAFECLDPDVQYEVLCYGIAKVALDPLTIGGASVFAGKAIAAAGRRTVGAVAQGVVKTVGYVDDGIRLARAQKIAGTLNKTQKDAVLKAHAVGRGQLGKDGVRPAGIGNYTPAQLKEKAEILKKADISEAARRDLMEAGVVGDELQTVSIPRKGGGYSNGVVAHDFGDEVNVVFTDAAGRINTKRVPKTQLGEPLNIGTGNLSNGDSVFVPLENSGFASGKVVGFDGKVAIVDYQRMDEWGMMWPTRTRVDPNVLRTSGAEVEFVTDGVIQKGTLQKVRNETDTAVVNYTNRDGMRSAISLPINHVRIPPPRAPIARAPSALAAVQNYKIDAIAPTAKGTYYSNGYWRTWSDSPIDKLPAQGWKLHVGARPESAQAIAETLLPELRKNGIAHKVVDNMEEYAGKSAADTQRGKYITIYPTSDVEARRIRQVVQDTLSRRGFAADDFEIPAGQRDFGMGLSGRYGRFTDAPQIDPRTGQAIPGSNDFLLTPDGRLVEDVRGVAAPAWAPSLDR